VPTLSFPMLALLAVTLAGAALILIGDRRSPRREVNAVEERRSKPGESRSGLRLVLISSLIKAKFGSRRWSPPTAHREVQG
jgi:hypothetical protein